MCRQVGNEAVSHDCTLPRVSSLVSQPYWDALDSEEESVTSHVFGFITVVPLLGREGARASIFSCVLSGNANIFLSQILRALLSLGFCQTLISELPLVQVK